MKSFKKAALASALVLLIAACGNNESKTVDATTNPAPTQTESTVPMTKIEPAQMTIEHLSGETKVNMNPQRVAAFDFGSLDTLEVLGVDVIGLPKANMPAYLSEYKDDKYINFGNLKEPNFEALHAANPDLAIIALRQAPLYEQFTEITPTINLNVDDADYMGSLEKNVTILGKLFNQEDLAKEKMESLKQQVAELKAQTENMPEKALILLANDGKISAYGPGSRFAFIYDVLGFKPADDTIKASRHGQTASFEYVVQLDPDYIFVVDRSAVVGNSETSAKQLIENDLVKNTKAFKNGKIVYLDPNVWYLSGGGLKSTQVMIDDIKSALAQ